MLDNNLLDVRFFTKYYGKNEQFYHDYGQYDGYIPNPSIFVKSRDPAEETAIKNHFEQSDISIYNFKNHNYYKSKYKFKHVCFYVINTILNKDNLDTLYILSKIFKHIYILDFYNKNKPEQLNGLPVVQNEQLIDISNYTKVFIIDNSISVKNTDIKNAIRIMSQSKADFGSLYDQYIKTKHRTLYGISSCFIWFKKDLSFLNTILKLYQNNNNINTEIFSEVIKLKKTINVFLPMKNFRALMYNRSTNIDLKYYSNILRTYGLPITPQGRQDPHIGIKSFRKKELTKVLLDIHIGDIRYEEEFIGYVNTFNNYSFKNSKVISNALYEGCTLPNNVYVDNKGMDIGSFILNTINNRHKNFDYIIKIHSKSLHDFRKYSINALLSNLDYYLWLFNKYKSTYSIFPEYNAMLLDRINGDHLDMFCQNYNISNFNYTNQIFSAGSFCIINYKIFKEFINRYKINLQKEYELMESGYCRNIASSQVHAWERILTGVVPQLTNSSVYYC